ncbi:hypothetical protein LWC33_15255 [Pseudonocardia sp. RS11V-5]|uniref:hypothetical protein n=1 Tax=Pseudonocardia terrae TaxID=2905831 RepID=UPI001E55EC0F|nr:hypothetical protein [Pseudonocardia terrae]MCE3552810.1 hypothetical protein [Pseudonocardia terrae]
MWEPVGPLPAHVYWKRRWLALLSVIGFFVVIGFSVAAFTRPTHDPGPIDEATNRAANSSALPSGSASGTLPGSAGSAGSASAAAPSTGAHLDPTTGDPSAGPGTSVDTPLSATGVPIGTSAPGATTSGGDPAGALVKGGPAMTTATTTDESKRPDDTPRASVPVPPTEPAPPTGPPPCTNDMIAVGAEIDAPQHRVGDRPELRLTVVNISNQACVRDLDGALQEIVVWDRPITTRLWSSNDCVNPSTQDLRTLVPGQPVAFAVTWSGLSSNPGCTAARTRLPAGDYTLLTRVADKISGPTYFTLTRA